MSWEIIYYTALQFIGFSKFRKIISLVDFGLTGKGGVGGLGQSKGRQVIQNI